MPELLQRLSGLKEKIPYKGRKTSVKPKSNLSREIFRSRNVGHEKRLKLGEEGLLSYAQERLGLFLRGSRPGSLIFRTTEDAIRAKMLESLGTIEETDTRQKIYDNRASKDPQKQRSAAFATDFNMIFELYIEAVHTHFTEPGYDRSKNKRNVTFLAAETAYRDFCLLFEQNQDIHSTPTTTRHRTKKQMYEAFLSHLRNYDYTSVKGVYPGNGTFVTEQYFQNKFNNIAIVPTGKRSGGDPTHYRDITISTDTNHAIDSNLVGDPLVNVLTVLNFESVLAFPRVIYVSMRSMQGETSAVRISKRIKKGKEKIKIHRVEPVTKARVHHLWPSAGFKRREINDILDQLPQQEAKAA